MRSGISSGPAGVTAMSSAIRAYCEKHDLAEDTDRQAVARRVMEIYAGGARTRLAILAGLAWQDGPSDMQSKPIPVSDAPIDLEPGSELRR